MKKIVKIQPSSQPDLSLPYPYYIDQTGSVGRKGRLSVREIAISSAQVYENMPDDI